MFLVMFDDSIKYFPLVASDDTDTMSHYDKKQCKIPCSNLSILIYISTVVFKDVPI